MARNRGRDEGCCGVGFVKSVLHIFNVLFLFAGVGVLGIAVWTILTKYEYVTLLTTVTYPMITYFLLTAGGLVLLVAFLGCCAVCKEHRPLLIFYMFLLLLIFLLEAMVGILAFVYEEQVQNELELNLNNTFLVNYKHDEDKTKAIDLLQEKFKCCGSGGYSDWKHSAWITEGLAEDNIVPDSCCKTVTYKCGRRTHPSNINHVGCLSSMADHMKSHLIILSAVGLGICVLQIFGIIFSCCLYFKLKDVFIDDV